MPCPALLVSIILRTDGRRTTYLAQAIESVRAQTYQNVELVVVEDGCPGATCTALNGAEPPPNTRIISIAKSGRSAAGNAGLEAARGELINFLDDDDLLLPQHLDVLVNAHKSGRCGAVYAWAWEAPTFNLAIGLTPVQEKHRTLIKPGPLTPASLLARNRAPIQAVLFRRSLYERCGGFDENLEYLEDWDLWLRYAASSPFLEVHEATSIYRIPAEKIALRDRAEAHKSAFDEVRRRLLRRTELFTDRTITRQPPAVSVVIVNYNASHHLMRCLIALQQQTMANFEAFVIDNASTDGSFECAAATVRDERIRYFGLPTNTGFAVANNLGATLAKAPWLATLNPDAFAEPTWLATLLDGAQRHPNAGTFGSTQIDARDPSRLDGTGDHYLFCGIPWRGGSGQSVQSIPAEGETFCACAAAALYKLEKFHALGGFDERYFCYVEDVDLAYRWRLTGGYTIQIPSAVVRHIGGASSEGNTSPIARYYGTRNLIWTFFKNTPASLLWFSLPAHLGALLVLLIKSLVRGDNRVILRAVIDAVRGIPSILETRREVQAKRTISTRNLSSALTWSIKSYLRRNANP